MGFNSGFKGLMSYIYIYIYIYDISRLRVNILCFVLYMSFAFNFSSVYFYIYFTFSIPPNYLVFRVSHTKKYTFYIYISCNLIYWWTPTEFFLTVSQARPVLPHHHTTHLFVYLILYISVSQQLGLGPIPGPGINYTIPWEILLEVVI